MVDRRFVRLGAVRDGFGLDGMFMLCLVLGGCGTLPDARPFADATGSLAASVAVSGRAVDDSLAQAGSAVPADAAAYERLHLEFDAAWSKRIAATRAAAAYSESIADLIAAGNQGAETVGKVGDALKALAEGAGVPVASAAVGAAGDIASFVAARIAVVRASDRLEAALARAQPAIDAIAEIIVGESEQQLEPILRNLDLNIRSGIRSAYEDDDNFAAAARKLRQAQRMKALNDPAAVAPLEAYDRMQATVAASLQTRDRKLDEAAAAYRARVQLVRALSAATLAWAQAHRDLAAAVREKRRASAGELIDTIAELKALTRKVSEL